MGDKLEYYCLKCGDKLVDKPTGYCPTCDCPYDLNNNITYSLLPRLTYIEAVVVTALFSFLTSFIFTFTVLSLAMMLPNAISFPLFVIAGFAYVVVAWMISLQASRLLSLIMLAIGFVWGPTIAAAITAYFREDFTRMTSFVDWMSTGIALSVIALIIFYPSWAVRQITVRRWRSRQTKNPA